MHSMTAVEAAREESVATLCSNGSRTDTPDVPVSVPPDLALNTILMDCWVMILAILGQD